MSWDSEVEHEAKERAKGAAAERERIRKDQAPALRNLKVLFTPECAELGDCTSRRHGDDCPRGMFNVALRWLRAGTKPGGRQ